MTFAASEKTGILRQRGFWLRCFLGTACLLSALWLVGAGVSWAKVEPAGPIHVWRLSGFFMTAAGKPIQDVEIMLLRDGAVVDKTKTDASGRFSFDHVTGRYTLHVDKAKIHSELSREVIVGLETATILRGKKLYVIAGPSACTDDCSSVFTSKSDFEKAVRRNTGHHD